MMNQMKGVTLISLVITIIVLLLLASVTIAMLTVDNGIITKAQEAKRKTEEAHQKEEADLQNLLNKITSEVPSEEGYNKNKNVNSPNVVSGMIPVKYNGTDWVVCSEEDPEWYNYDNQKEWANIMLSDGTYKDETVQVGQIVNENELGSMYIWIPRYAYKIIEEKNIEVNFLKGTTNKDKNEKEYTENESVDTKTTPIVHPAFKLGERNLRGIWVAKFEASGTNKNGQAVGNASSSSNAEQYVPDETTIAKSLPNKISWRHITIGESQKRSMDIAGSQKEKYGLNNANSHLIKNNEWGAVAYLCYSQYGNVPKTNGAAIGATGRYYDLYTGQGPKSKNDEGTYSKIDNTHNYDTENGVLASTTGNITGIYDMNGGAWERVGGYLDNGNENLNNYGKSLNKEIKYFENGKVKSTYSSLWESYEVSEEEKNNKIVIEDGTTLTQGELWDWNKKEEKYHEARRRITGITYNNMTKHKGIGINEMSNEYSFYAPYGNANNQKWGWFMTINQAVQGTTTNATGWDNDAILIAGMDAPFIVRGGGPGGEITGVFYIKTSRGFSNYDYGFRSVIIV